MGELKIPTTENVRSGGGLNGRHKYGLLDRVLDNMSIDITNVKAELRTWGKFKTRFIGVHTPPVVRFELQQLKLYSVDEFGEPLQEKWPKVNGKIIVYKKMEFIMKLQVEKISGVNSGSDRRTIMSE